MWVQTRQRIRAQHNYNRSWHTLSKFFYWVWTVPVRHNFWYRSANFVNFVESMFRSDCFTYLCHIVTLFWGKKSINYNTFYSLKIVWQCDRDMWSVKWTILILDTFSFRPPAPSLQIRLNGGDDLLRTVLRILDPHAFLNLKGGCGRAKLWKFTFLTPVSKIMARSKGQERNCFDFLKKSANATNTFLRARFPLLRCTSQKRCDFR